MKNKFGNAIILLIVGLFPLIIGVIYTYCSNDQKNEAFVMSLCSLLGGILDVYVASKEYTITINDNVKKPNFKLLFCIMILAFFYTITTGCLCYKNDFIEWFGSNETLSISEWIAVGIFAPLGEELIYRFSIFSALCNKSIKKTNILLAMILSALIFMILHLEGGVLRNLDLFMFGCVAAMIFFMTKNIIYSILFHSVSNFTIYGMAIFYQKNFFNQKLLYFSIPIFIILAIEVILMIKKDGLKITDKENV